MVEKTLTAERQNLEQLIVFRISDEEFGVLISSVQEIIKVGTITPIPDSPKFIKGLINVRGDIIPTIDIKTRLLLPSSTEVPKHIVLTEQDGNIFGLIVDEVTEVLRLQQSEIKPAPQLITKVNKEYVSGIFTKEGRPIIILDLARILSENELTKLITIKHKASKKNHQSDLPKMALKDSSKKES